jgi:hypothetical protein
MYKRIVFVSVLLVSKAIVAQTQIGNSDMEIWEDLGAATESPQNWSGIKEASGSQLFISFAPQGIFQSTDTPTGTGFSALIQTQGALSIPANGTMTCGQLNVGSATAADVSNYSWTNMGSEEFSEACTDTPDSIVFWAKFIGQDPSHNARMKATLHDDFNYQDPEDAASSQHVVATAVLNYPSTNGWERKSVPFDYSGPASNNTHILVTFTTNEIPGVGTIGDQVFIDDVTLIYNSSEIKEVTVSTTEVYMDNLTNELNFSSEVLLDERYEIYDMSGQKIASGIVAQKVPFYAPAGAYIIHVNTEHAIKQFKVFKN